MKEFIDKLIGRLEEEQEAYSDTTYYALGIGSAIKIVNQLAEEYKQDQTFQYVQLQTEILKRMGIDISCKWETATQQASALNEAYMRGMQDERDKFARWQDEHKGGWIPCSERLPEVETDVFICTKQNGIAIASLSKPDIFWTDEEGFHILDVIAWQPLPQPFVRKDD